MHGEPERVQGGLALAEVVDADALVEESADPVEVAHGERRSRGAQPDPAVLAVGVGQGADRLECFGRAVGGDQRLEQLDGELA